MSKELMYRSAGTLSRRDETGGSLMRMGIGGLGLWTVSLLPFINLPMIFVALVVAGFLIAKGDS